MRIYNINGRAALGIGPQTAVDIFDVSHRRFGPDPQTLFDDWSAFTAWAKSYQGSATIDITPETLGAPVPHPTQIFAVGLNYRSHALESNLAIPESPFVFAKYPTAVTGPHATITLPPGSVDYEAELVAVIGRRADRVNAADAWFHVAGLTAGQDLSERQLQWAGPAPQQFSLSKSFIGFAPIGPAVVSIDEWANPDDVEISCHLNGRRMQHGSSSDLIFAIPQIIEYLSAITPLLPGDLIFTGTPSGVGAALKPPVFIQPGDVLETDVIGIGTMRHTFVAPDDREQ